MKKILLFASALAGLFIAGSCQRENLEPMESANTVTYTVTVPDALATKGIGDNVANVNTLHYEVYRTAAAETVTFTDADRLLYHRTATVTNGKAQIELELVNDQNFTVLFWAHVQEQTDPMAMENEAYNVADLRNVTLKPSVNANQVDYAAFSGVDFIKATEKLASKTVPLTRPVAQINLGTTEASLKAFNTPITLDGSSMTVVGLSNTFDVAKQAASSELISTTVYAKQNVPTTDKLTVNTTDYVYVGMNYAGFAPIDGTPVTVSYVINTTEGDIANTIENVPVKPNYRTNIIGNLITSKTDYIIELNNTWRTPEEVVEVFAVDTAEELQDAIDSIQDGAEGNIILEGDIELGALAALLSTRAGENPYGLLIPAGKTIILDLNGCTLKQEVECKASYSMIKNQGNLTITGNGTISFKDLSAGGGSEWGSYVIDNTGYLTVENGTIVHLGSTNFTVEHRPTNIPIQNYAGKVVVNDGIISSPSFRSLRDFTAGGEIIINGGQFLGQVWMQGLGAGSSSLTINGGEFNPTAGYDGSSVYITNGTNDVQVSITGGTFNTKIGCADANKSGVKGCVTGGMFKADPSAFVADDYVAVYDENAEVWNIAEAYAKVGETKYTSLNDAVIEALKLENANIIVLRDTEMGAVTVPNGKTITIDLNDKTVSNITTGTTNPQDAILVKGNLTVKNGTITTEHKGENLGWSAQSSIFNITGGGIVNLKDVVAKNLGGTDMGFVAHLNNWGEVTLNVENSTLEANYVAVRVFNSGYDKNNVTIKSSTLKGGNYAFWVHNYTVADFGTAEKAIAQQKLLNFNLTEGNTFVGKNDTPIRLGMTGSMYLAADQIGNLPTYASVDSEETLIAALKNASNVNSIIYFTKDITISNNWDNRYTGAKTSKPIEINGNGKTLKFTSTIDDKNYFSVFRFENTAVVKNLKFDFTEAQGTLNRIRAISAKTNLVVETCEFIGNQSVTNSRAIIYGEGQSQSQYDAEILISGCEFINWTRGITDNENAKDVRKVTVTGNTFNNAHAYMSAYESVTFTGNTMNNSCVNIKSYSAPDSVIITVSDNDLDEDQPNRY